MTLPSLPSVWRIYAKGKPYKHLGNVEAATEADALDKALKGVWKGYWAEDADKPTSIDNLAAQL